MSNWLRLVRWKNLVIVFLTQMLVWLCVLRPMRNYFVLPFDTEEFLLNGINITCLALSTVFITAAGYIINDYFDISIDSINKPEKMILERVMPRRMGIILHFVLNLTGILLAAFVAIQAHHLEWILLQICCIILLWFYSTHFKRQFMTGNVVVSLLTALTIITIVLYQPMLHAYLTEAPFVTTTVAISIKADLIESRILPNPIWLLGTYTYFAFMLTWVREIVKDMEDYNGDAEAGCMTMPIKWGLRRAARFAQILGLLVMLPLITAGIKLLQSGWWLMGIYTLAALVLPLSIWAALLPGKTTPTQLHMASRQLKIIMVLGVGSLIIYFIKAHA